jgi:heavy metal sensor kinase
VEDFGEPIGFQQIINDTDSNNRVKGLGYWGKRGSSIYYFIGVFPQNPADELSIARLAKDVGFLQKLCYAADRRGNFMFMQKPDSVSMELGIRDVWAYLYQFDQDSVIWISKPIEQNKLFLPTEYYEKDYYFNIQNKMGNNYRQYTEVHDRTTKYVYRVDVAFPMREVDQAIMGYALFLFGGALLLSIAAWAGGHLTTRRALKPVDDILKSVNEITSRNLDRRLPVPELNNEMSKLIVTFNELLDRLSKSFRMQKSFIADASHELRTPLSILMSDIETVIKKVGPESNAANNLKEAVSEIEHMARIVEDMRLLAYSDSGQVDLDKKVIRLDDVLMSTLSRCQVIAKEKGVYISIGNVDIVEYKGDEEMLIRALSNLVNNAVKFSEPKGKVNVSLSQIDHRAHFEVSDNGAGISNHDLPKIFERFFRADRSRSRKTGGSGLGLAIAKWIVEQHAGQIYAESTPGQGSTFIIDLPFS